MASNPQWKVCIMIMQLTIASTILNNKFVYIKYLGASPARKGFQHFPPGRSWLCLALTSNLRYKSNQMQCRGRSRIFLRRRYTCKECCHWRWGKRNLKANTCIWIRKLHLRRGGGGVHSLHPPTRSTPAVATLHQTCQLLVRWIHSRFELFGMKSLFKPSSIIHG